MRRSVHGFTFVEILVALAVFGLLSAIAVPRYRLYRERAYLGALRSELGSLRVAEEAFWAENQSYSADTAQLDWNGSSQVSLSISSGDLTHGFSAIARHASVPNLQCATSVGAEATTTASGDIVCTLLTSGTGSGITP
ncbi:MAG: type IV pilin protein [Gemmatimonadaceae bacterium]